MTRPELVVLLSARNCADDLPGYLLSVEGFADAVVGLDDGSTDRTRDILKSHPLVQVLLEDPPRPTYRGWHQGPAYNRLLAAASDLAPQWILTLDADERLDPTDATALRTFLRSQAVRGDAYLFRVYRMIGGLTHYDHADLLVGRLFSWEPGQRFPEEGLHFVPIPTSVPRDRWRRTTLRIQHLNSLTAARRRARFAKYRELDPDHVFQRSYQNLLAPPGKLWPWWPRTPDLPVLANTPVSDRPRPRHETPLLSAIVIAQNDEDSIDRAVRSVVNQICPEPLEVIVVTSGTDRTAEIVRTRFPDTKLVELDHPAFPGEARNRGLAVATGTYVSFPGSHVELPPGSLATRLRAHQLGYPMVTGTLLNGTPTLSGWASYFLDNGPVLPGVPSQPLAYAPIRCSYLRQALVEAGGFPEESRAGEDTAVNFELFRRGYAAYRCRELRLIHHSPCRNPWRLAHHHFHRGRAYGLILLSNSRRQGRFPNRWVIRRIAEYPVARLWRTLAAVLRWGEETRRWLVPVLPLLILGIGSAWLGACVEVIRKGGALRRELRLAHNVIGQDVAASVDHEPDNPQFRLDRATITVSQGSQPAREGPDMSFGDERHSVALTFDDGPSEDVTPKILDELRRVDVKATFFVLGGRAAEFPDIVRRELAEGMAVANHTWGHARLAGKPEAYVRSEIKRTQDFLAGLSAHATLFRPPYGSYDAETVAVASTLGLRTILWTVDPKDFSAPDPETIVQRVLAMVTPGAIILLHDGGGDRSRTLEALPNLISALEQRGYSFSVLR